MIPAGRRRHPAPEAITALTPRLLATSRRSAHKSASPRIVTVVDLIETLSGAWLAIVAVDRDERN